MSSRKVRSNSFSVGLPRTVCDFVCILSVIAIKFLSLTSSEELSMKAAVAKAMRFSRALARFRECIDYMHYISIYNRDTSIDR